MPYITRPKRNELLQRVPSDSGELSYELTTVVNKWMQSRPNGGWNGAIAPALAAIEGLRIAFEDEIVLPYERAKRQDNGQCFDVEAI